MVVRKTNSPDLDAVFHALADPTRRDIVKRCLIQEYSVSELAETYPMSFAAVQKHVAVLETAYLVVKRKAGREQRVRSRVTTIVSAQQALSDLEALWVNRMSAMEDVLRSDGAMQNQHQEDLEDINASDTGSNRS